MIVRESVQRTGAATAVLLQRPRPADGDGSVKQVDIVSLQSEYLAPPELAPRRQQQGKTVALRLIVLPVVVTSNW